MTDIICPLCGKPNPPELSECRYCQAPLKTGGFLPPSDQEGEGSQFLSAPGISGEGEKEPEKPTPASPLEQAIPDWLKNTEANFLEGAETEPERPGSDDISAQIDSLLNPPSAPESPAKAGIDDAWLASLLADAGGEPVPFVPKEEQLGEEEETIVKPFDEEPSEEEIAVPTQQFKKPDWLAGLEAASKIKLEGEITPAEPIIETGMPEPEAEPSPLEIPDWIGQAELSESPPAQEAEPQEAESQEAEPQIAPAELPGWLEALRPDEEAAATEPVEDFSAADVVAAGPLVGLRGVISAQPSAIRARKPPTYSIKLRVTDEQRARVEMMEALLADEQKPKPLPAQAILTTRNIFRLVIAAVLILPIAWMVITGSRKSAMPQPGSIPGVVDFTEQIQTLPAGIPVLLAFDYEPGFSGEMNLATSTLINQLLLKNMYLALVTTNPSGPALAEGMLKSVIKAGGGSYLSYTNLGYLPGGTMGLLGLADSPRAVLPYSLDSVNVWTAAPMNAISTINDFGAVIVMTNDPETARSWIEQVGPVLKQDGTPLLIVTSSQAEPLIRPYYEANPRQVQGMVAGLAGGLAYGRTVGNIQQNGTWDAYGMGITTSALLILAGSIIGVVLKMPASDKKKEK